MIVTMRPNDYMVKKTLHVDEETHKKAKILSTQTGIPIGDIVQLLIEGTNEKELLKLAEKKK